MNSTGENEILKPYAPRTLLARFIGTFGMLFLTAAIYGIINKPEDWKYAAGMAVFGVLLITFTISLLKDTSPPMSVHLNRAAFFTYVLLFAISMWGAMERYSRVVCVMVAGYLFLSIVGLACSFIHKKPARWLLASLQTGILLSFGCIILRAYGLRVFTEHPVALGLWLATISTLVISLFGKKSNAYYAVQLPQPIEQSKEN